MGSIVMHLAVGKKIQEKYNFSKDFLVGAVAPDILKFKYGRDETHYINNYDNYELDRYINENKKRNDYFYGYLTHLITDYIWFDKYMKKFEDEFSKKYSKSCDEDKFREEIYSDYNMTNSATITCFDIDIRKINEYTHKYFKDEELDLIIDNLIKEYFYDETDSKLNYLSIELINNYIEEAYQKTIEIIEKLR